MLKLKFLFLFIFFIQVAPNLLNIENNDLISSEQIKCIDIMSQISGTDSADKCVARSSLLSKGHNGTCCFYSFKIDPIVEYKKKYRENWKKIVAQSKGYDLNISEEEIRKKLSENAKEQSICLLTMKGSHLGYLVLYSLTAIDNIVKYDIGQGQKIFNIKEFHPSNKNEIAIKELIEARFIYNEKECLKKGTKLSTDDAHICWCEKIPLSAGEVNEKICLGYTTSTFKEQLKKEMDEIKKEGKKVEYKCTCSNNKSKTIKGSFNSVTGDIKV